MIKNTLIILLTALTLFAFSCGEKKSNSKEELELSELKAEVIAIHDSAMSKMDQIMTLSRELKVLKLESGDTVRVDQAIADLTASHEQMMTWMREFSSNFPEGTLSGDNQHHHGHHASQHGDMDHTTISSESMDEALRVELAKIEKVSNNINSAIRQAEDLLQ